MSPDHKRRSLVTDATPSLNKKQQLLLTINNRQRTESGAPGHVDRAGNMHLLYVFIN